MSTIKSSAENLTLNADGANNDIKFQSNGSEVASIDQAGTITATTFTGAGSTPSIVDGGNATAITIDSNENVGIGTTSPAQKLDIQDSNYGVRISPVPSSKFVRIQFPTNEGNALDNEKYIIAYNNAHSGHPHMMALKSNNSAGTVGFFTNNAERMRIQSGGGISFNGDTAAANALSDYEEGTWTPSFSGNIAFSTKYNFAYTKIGKIVHITGYVNNSSGSFGTSWSVSGLPYAGNANYNVACLWSHGIDADYMMYMTNGSTSMTIRDRDGASMSGGEMSFQCTYLTNQ